MKTVPNLKILMTGIAFGESPRWHEDRLWFSDWIAQEVIAVDLQGKSEVITHVRSLPFSIDWLSDGRLLVTSGRNVLHIEADGSLVTYADLSDLTTYGWNEIVVDGRDNVYVNGAEFDLMAGEEFRPGIIALVASDGTARTVADGVAFPNGMAVTSDNSTLIVAESYGKKLTAFDLEQDAGLSNRRVWADLNAGVPDGICIDAEGAVWYADVPNRCCVRVREGGEVLQLIELDRGCFSCELGGPNGTTLFMVAEEWGGTAAMGSDRRTGCILTTEVAVPAAWKEET